VGSKLIIPVTRRVKGYNRFVGQYVTFRRRGKYVTGRRKYFRPYKVYIFPDPIKYIYSCPGSLAKYESVSMKALISGPILLVAKKLLGTRKTLIYSSKSIISLSRT